MNISIRCSQIPTDTQKSESSNYDSDESRSSIGCPSSKSESDDETLEQNQLKLR
jgi:hypothetical protein